MEQRETSHEYKPHYPVSEDTPKVFFEVSIGGVAEPQKIIFELFQDTVPRTAENFRCLCTGEKGCSDDNKLLFYKNCPFHRIVEGFTAQAGDITKGDGTGGISIYGKHFDDEPFGPKSSHLGPGIISMANDGPNSNSSQFFIVLSPLTYLDQVHVVFGQVIEGFDVLHAISRCGTASGIPKKPVIITECGQL
eukprot:TRINITY_DN20620_c0_g1_i1.p1 TRINITY_DN20620_c0_g1~~TRINITY_DN20620_c0_g1_i1.p1  ORF type:complete len:192 (+),score=28.47 TRINITY_DN20620_c0_g1_i1:114-689(+)